uniref:ABC transporter domain-containing protein n=1 Tax=Heligmosomoides polygyrus TaxID=6339 RepID=A0A183FX85_HELPZ
LTRCYGRIEFKDVRFKNTPVLKGLSWVADPGETIALVGKSGCGKSTSIGLLTRLYDHDDGSILIDGRDIRSLNTSDLRKMIGVVEQEPCLFNGTIRENIVLGRAICEADTEEAARTANAHDFIMKLEKGYETVIGSGGITLSGGQKQRLAIARAIASQPKILLLDEATSALDSESEKAVQLALNRASRGRTTVVITHRLSALKDVQRIYILENGRVAEKGSAHPWNLEANTVLISGSHFGLLAKRGIYSTLVAAQDIGVGMYGRRRSSSAKTEPHTLGSASSAQANRSGYIYSCFSTISPLLTQRGLSRSSTSSIVSQQVKGLHKEKVTVQVQTKPSGSLSSVLCVLLLSVSLAWRDIPAVLLRSALLSCFLGQPDYQCHKRSGAANLESFRRQASLGGLQALGSLSTIVEMVHEAIVFLVDVVHDGIFPKADKRGVEIPVDGRSGTPLLELRGLLSLTRKAEPRAKEAVVRSRVELWDNGDIGQAILAIENDVVDLVVELATGGFPGPQPQPTTSALQCLDYRFMLMVNNLVAVVACIALSTVHCWPAGVGMVVVISLFTVFTWLASYRISANMRRRSKLDRTSELSIEIIEHAKTIQLLGVEQFFMEKYESYEAAAKSPTKRIAVYQSIQFGLTQCYTFLSDLVMYFIGAHMIFHGQTTSMETVVAGTSGNFAGWAVIFASAAFGDFVRSHYAAKVLYALIDIYRKEEGGQTPDIDGSVKVEDVDFSYPSRPDVKVARNLNLIAEKGQSIALVGVSGSGKSTIVQLLERFYEPNSGSIKLDDNDIAQMCREHLRNNVALVGQEPVLFKGSIVENVSLGLENASLSEVQEACRQANAANFIELFPQVVKHCVFRATNQFSMRYETDVGEKGGNLSGGQKQRIAIARALIRRPKIILLDEATSALDAESEKTVQKALNEASQGRTSITIAHRLSTVKDVDRIYYVENGAVVECGTHQELIEADGKYAKLVKAQQLAEAE